MTAVAAALDEQELIGALRAGDESAFATVLDCYHSSLLRLALSFVRDRQVAEEVVSDTWLGVIRGIHRFRGESSLKTWIFHILTNQAKTRALRERRTIPFSALAGDPDEPSADPDRFFPEGHPWAGHWTAPPTSWDDLPEEALASRETMACVRAAIEALPPMQRRVISLRDVDGWNSEEVCELLGLSEGNQRVLLHRARAKVRAALEDFLPAE